MMLLDVFLEGLFEIDLRRVNSEEVGHAMNTVLVEANERIKFPLRKMFVHMVAPRVRRLRHGSYSCCSLHWCRSNSLVCVAALLVNRCNCGHVDQLRAVMSGMEVAAQRYPA